MKIGCARLTSGTEMAYEKDTVRTAMLRTFLESDRYGVLATLGQTPERAHGGSNVRRMSALAAAVGEAVERYSLATYHPSVFVRKYIGDLHWAPDFSWKSLVWFLPAQYAQEAFPFQSPDPKVEIDVVKGYNPIFEIYEWLPANLVYLPYIAPKNDPLFSFQISTGTSCAHTWYASEDVALALRFLGGTSLPDLDVRAFDITTDLQIPVVLVCVRSHSRSPTFSIGSAAAFSHWDALLKALIEAIMSWRSTSLVWQRRRYIYQEIVQEIYTHPTFFVHALYYAFPESAPHFDFLWYSSHAPRHCAPGESPILHNDAGFSYLVDTFRRHGQHLALVDCTPTDVASWGLFVVRAVSVSLVRQSVGLWRHLGNQRIVEVPARLGYALSCSPEELLDDFHPVP